MRQLKNYLLASVGLVIITVAATVTVTQGVQGKEVSKPSDVLVVNDASNPALVADVDTVLPSQIVSLTSHTGSSSICPNNSKKQFVEILPNGQQRSTPFEVRTVPTRIEVYHQREATPDHERSLVSSYQSLSYVGMNNAFHWVFEKDEELRPGVWTVDLTIDHPGTHPFSLVHSFHLP